MTTLRHAAYRASLLATSASRIPRVLIPRSLRFTEIARPSVATFSTKYRPLSDEVVRSQVGGAYGETVGAPPAGTVGDNRVLYVGNLFFDVTNQQLRQHFESFGTINSARIVTNTEGQSRGYGFVQFADESSADAAKHATNLSTFAGRRIVVHAAKPMSGNPRPRDRGTQSSTLFVGNLSYDMTDKELNELFRPLKNIRDVRVSVDRHTGRPRGFAHADFLDVESANAAMQILDGKVVRDRILRVDYSSALGRGGKEAVAKHELNNPATFDEPQNSSLAEESTSSSDNTTLTGQNEGSHEPPQNLEDQPEKNQEQGHEQPGEHATQKLEDEVDKVPEEQAEQK